MTLALPLRWEPARDYDAEKAIPGRVAIIYDAADRPLLLTANYGVAAAQANDIAATVTRCINTTGATPLLLAEHREVVESLRMECNQLAARLQRIADEWAYDPAKRVRKGSRGWWVRIIGSTDSFPSPFPTKREAVAMAKRNTNAAFESTANNLTERLRALWDAVEVMERI